jgi:hypothetical protein
LECAEKGNDSGSGFWLVHVSNAFRKGDALWAYRPDGTNEKLVEKPWEEVDYWMRAFNKNRKEELVVGTDLILDELMIAWKEKKGNGGIPHLSFVERKPIPLGTECKVVCEGSMGMCVYIEIQKGKITMQRQKWCHEYKATAAFG